MMTEIAQLVRVYIPALAPLLMRAEQLKGSPLTEEEVLHIRDTAVCQMLPIEQAQQLARGRGYEDIDPENCWNEWQQLRAELSGEGLNALDADRN